MHINGQPETVAELKEKEERGDIPLSMVGLGVNHPFFQRDKPKVRRCLICLRGKYCAGLHWICYLCFLKKVMDLDLLVSRDRFGNIVNEGELYMRVKKSLVRDCI